MLYYFTQFLSLMHNSKYKLGFHALFNTPIVLKFSFGIREFEFTAKFDQLLFYERISLNCQMWKDKIHYILQTKTLELRPYCKKYVKEYQSWFQKDEQLLYLTGSQPLTYEQQLQNHKSWLSDPKKYTFLVFVKQNNKLVGDVNLFFSDWIQQNEAEINIMIAVKQYRGKGFAHQIMQVIQDFVTGIYQKNQIIAKIKDDNRASIKFFEKIGYKFINHNKTHGEVQYRKILNLHDKEQVIEKLKQHNKMKILDNQQQLFQI